MRASVNFTTPENIRKEKGENIIGFKSYSKEIADKFYSSLKFNKFNNISKERMAEIDELASIWRDRLKKKYVNTPAIATGIANQLIASRQKFNLTSDDEVLYFYVKVVDANFKFLELSQIAKDKKELVNLVIRQFGIYDNVIIYLEQHLDRRLQEIAQSQTEKR